MKRRSGATNSFASKSENCLKKFCRTYFWRSLALIGFVSIIYIKLRSEHSDDIVLSSKSSILFLCTENVCNTNQLRKKVARYSSKSEVKVFCNFEKCMQQFKNAAELEGVQVLRANVRKVCEGSPLADFGFKSTVLKLVTGSYFPSLLHEVISVCIIWKFGGLYLEVNEDQFPKYSSAFRGYKFFTSKKGMLHYSEFERGSQILHSLMGIMRKSVLELDFRYWDIDRFLSEAIDGKASAKQKEMKLNTKVGAALRRRDFKVSNQYGTLSYDHRVRTAFEANVGDEIQSFPGLQFIPCLHYFVDRDTWSLEINFFGKSKSAGKDIEPERTENFKILTFLNAWYGALDMQWPPPPYIKPILFGLFVGNGFKNTFIENESRSYIDEYGPIGARDTSTFRFFQAQGIKSYLSACATLLLGTNPITRVERDEILAVDVQDTYLKKALPKDIYDKTTQLVHNIPDWLRYNKLERYKLAWHLLERYSKAKLVITSRIHCALPCVAMGTPVIFVQSRSLPGGVGNRTAGLTELFHEVRFDAKNEIIKNVNKFNWNNPPPNPNFPKLRIYKCRSWFEIQKEQELKDMAYSLGLIPLSPSHNNHNTFRSRYFQIYVTGKFNAVNQRSVESVLLADPNAELIILSNQKEPKIFQILSECGFDISVRPYNIERYIDDLNEIDYETFGAVTRQFSAYLPELRSKHSWIFEEKQLLKLMVLYIFGGIFIENDVLLLKDLNFEQNALGYQDSRSERVSDSVMKFEPGSILTKRSILLILNKYISEKLFLDAAMALNNAIFGRDDVFQCSKEGRKVRNEITASNKCEILLLPSDAFYPIERHNLKHICFSSVFEFVENEYNRVSSAYSVQIYEKETPVLNVSHEGTICRRLLNERCILCNMLV